MDELIRLAMAAGLAAIIIAASLAARAFYRRRLAAHRDEPAADLAARYELPAGQSAILYLWGDRCVQCVALQEPAIDRLSATHPVQVRKLRAVTETELTSRFNILTVPSTVVIGPDHRVRGVNIGFTDEQTLGKQLSLTS